MAFAAGVVVMILVLAAVLVPRLGAARSTAAVANSPLQPGAVLSQFGAFGSTTTTDRSAAANVKSSGALQPSSSGAYDLSTAGEPPETVARDRRGPQFIWPSAGDISTYFHEAGPYWVGGYHQGLDIAAWWGWNVFAAGDGVVVEAQEGWNRGYGNTILIDHRNGLQTRYAHLQHILAETGDTVKAGNLIGLVGSTGASEGPHLHFEVIVDGQLRDPLDYLPPDPSRD